MDVTDPESRPRQSWLHAWWTTKIYKDEHLLEWELVALAMSTGIVDVVSFPKFHCFVSNQTGNTVLFAVRALSLFGTREKTNFSVPVIHLAVSLGCFLLGVFVPAQIANRLDCKFSRWWLLSVNSFQTLLVMIVALINLLFDSDHFTVPNEDINSAPVLCTIGLLAVAAGGQVAMSRQLNMPEIPTTQATAAYVDLFVDPNFFAGFTESRARSRNRRIGFLLALISGSFIGAPAYRFVSTAFTIFLAGLVKLLVLVAFCFNRSFVDRRMAKLDGQMKADGQV